MEPIEIRVHEDITTDDGVKLRSKQAGIREYAGETLSRREWSGGRGIWVVRTRMRDKLRDWYEERVVDPETGAILHECAEPLSAHQGHGSAKKRPASHGEQHE